MSSSIESIEMNETNIKRLKDKLKLLQQQNVEYVQRSQNSNFEMKKLQDQFQQETEQFQRQLEQKTKELENLKQELEQNDPAQYQQQIEDFEQEIKNLQDKIQQKNDECKKMQDQINKINNQIQIQNQQMNEYQNQIQILNQQKLEQEQENQQLIVQKDLLQNQINDQSLILQSKTDLIQNLSNQLDAKVCENQTIQKNENQKDLFIQELKQEILILKKQINEQKVLQAKMEDQKRETEKDLTQKKEKICNQDEQIQNFKQQLKDFTKVQTESQNQKQIINELRNELNTKAQTLNNQQDQITQEKLQIAELKQQIKNFECKFQELENQKKSIQKQANQQLDLVNKESKEKTNQIFEQENNIYKINEELVQINLNFQKAQTEIEMKQQEINNLQFQKSLLEKEYDQYIKHVQMQMKKIKKKENELMNQKEKLRNFSNQKKQVNIFNTQQKNIINTCCIELKEELLNIKKQKQKLIINIQQKENLIQELNEQNQQHQHKNQEIENQLKNMLRNTSRVLDLKNKKFTKIEKQNKILQQTNDNYKKEIYYMKPFINKKSIDVCKSLSKCVKNSKSKVFPQICNNSKQSNFNKIYQSQVKLSTQRSESKFIIKDIVNLFKSPTLKIDQLIKRNKYKQFNIMQNSQENKLYQRQNSIKLKKGFLFLDYFLQQKLEEIKNDFFDVLKTQNNDQRKYISKIMYLLSRKFQTRIDEDFFEEQIKYYMIKNNIQDPLLLQVTEKANIKIKEGEKSVAELNKKKELITLYLSIELFLPLDLMFRRKINSIYRQFFQQYQKYMEYLMYQKAVKIMTGFLNIMHNKYTDQQQFFFQRFKKCRKVDFKGLIIFLQYFFEKKNTKILKESFKLIPRNQNMYNLPLVLRSKFRFKINVYYFNFFNALKQTINIKESHMNQLQKKFLLNFLTRRILTKNQKTQKKYLKILRKKVQDIIQYRGQKLEKFAANIQKVINHKQRQHFDTLYYHCDVEVIEIVDKTHELELNQIEAMSEVQDIDLLAQSQYNSNNFQNQQQTRQSYYPAPSNYQPNKIRQSFNPNANYDSGRSSIAKTVHFSQTPLTFRQNLIKKNMHRMTIGGQETLNREDNNTNRLTQNSKIRQSKIYQKRATQHKQRSMIGFAQAIEEIEQQGAQQNNIIVDSRNKTETKNRTI